MIKFENECVGCPPEMGCLGSSCPNRRVPRLYCNFCNEEVEELYEFEGEQICEDCLLKQFNKVNIEDFDDY